MLQRILSRLHNVFLEVIPFSLFNNIVDLVHLTLNDLHYYHYGPSEPPYYLSSYLTYGEYHFNI